jgi:hypothetical protein
MAMIALERGAVPASGFVQQADVRAALKAHEDAVVAAKAADRAYLVLERRGKAEAEARDAQAAADALANGAKDPGSKFVAKYESDVIAGRRQASATRIIEERAWQGVRAAFERHGGELQEMAEEEIERCRNSYLEAIDQLQVTHDALVRALAWQQFFARDGLGHGVFRAAQPPFSSTVAAPAVHTLDDTRITTVSLLAALRELGAPPPKVRPGVNPQAVAAAEGEDFTGQLQQPHWPLAAQGVRGRIAPDSGPSTWPMPRVPG